MKKIYIYGNCQANAIGGLLKICEAFNENYVFERLTPVHRMSRDEHELFCKNKLPECDVLLYQPVSENFRGGGFSSKGVVKYLPSSAVALSFPSLQFYGYQALSAPIKSIPAENARLASDLFGIPSSDLFHSYHVLDAYLSGANISEAVEIYEKGDADSASHVISRVNKTIDHMKLSEAESNIDLKFSDFCEREFNSVKLFHTPRHPTGYSFLHLIESFLKYIDLPLKPDEKERIVRRDPLKIPLYPIQLHVKEALGLSFEREVNFQSKKLSLDMVGFISAFYELYSSVEAQLLEDWRRDIQNRVFV